MDLVNLIGFSQERASYSPLTGFLKIGSFESNALKNSPFIKTNVSFNSPLSQFWRQNSRREGSEDSSYVPCESGSVHASFETVLSESSRVGGVGAWVVVAPPSSAGAGGAGARRAGGVIEGRRRRRRAVMATGKALYLLVLLQVSPSMRPPE